MTSERLTVAFTVDVEPDCPPFLTSVWGIERGLPALLDLLASEGVHATFFTTGEIAARFPLIVERLVVEGHELACHGQTHTAFTELDTQAARDEIERAAAILRRFAPVTSFRAPYLRFPARYVELLVQTGFTLDSSQAKYKAQYYVRSGKREREEGAGGGCTNGIVRIPASVTSSVLRLPRALRAAYLGMLSSPAVLFVHPWEFVDLRRERIRIDCRFRTGATALACVRDVLRSYARRGGRFALMRELEHERRAFHAA